MINAAMMIMVLGTVAVALAVDAAVLVAPLAAWLRWRHRHEPARFEGEHRGACPQVRPIARPGPTCLYRSHDTVVAGIAGGRVGACAAWA
jgi:hypothetical protein